MVLGWDLNPRPLEHESALITRYFIDLGSCLPNSDQTRHQTLFQLHHSRGNVRAVPGADLAEDAPPEDVGQGPILQKNSYLMDQERTRPIPAPGSAATEHQLID